MGGSLSGLLQGEFRLQCDKKCMRRHEHAPKKRKSWRDMESCEGVCIVLKWKIFEP